MKTKVEYNSLSKLSTILGQSQRTRFLFGWIITDEIHDSLLLWDKW